MGKLIGILVIIMLFGALDVSLAGNPFAAPTDARLLTDVQYGKAGATPLLLDLLLPKHYAGKKLPVVVWIHGGGWTQGTKSDNTAAWLAGHGHVVASIDYRLSGQAIFPAQVHDCKAAVRFLRAHAKEYGIDSKRIGVWGISAGGHLAALLGVSGGVKELEGRSGNRRYSSRVQAVCDFCGPVVLTLTDSRRVVPGAVEALLGGPVKRNMDLARAASPTTYVSHGNAPTLIMSGEKDDLVPISQSEIFYEALKKAGVEATFVRLKGGHGFLGEMNDQGLQETLRTVREFFDKWLTPT